MTNHQLTRPPRLTQGPSADDVSLILDALLDAIRRGRLDVVRALAKSLGARGYRLASTGAGYRLLPLDSFATGGSA